MRPKNLLISLIASGAALGLVVKAAASRYTGPIPAPAAAAGESDFAELEAYLARQLNRLNIPGAALAVVEGDQIVRLRCFGRARPGGEAPTPQTPFFIGSLTKSYTALAVMQLVEDGKVDLDAPVQKYLPWFRAADSLASARISVLHLLNQTSGLPVLPGMANLANFDDCPDAAEIQARELASTELAHPPGLVFQYSNLNYNLLGLILEAASGMSYSDYIQQNIFGPLGMRHSYTSKTTAQRDGLAVGHSLWFGIPAAVPGLPVPRGSLSSGQLICSVEDMARYLIAHLNEGRCGGAQILSKDGIQVLQQGAAEIREMGQTFGFYGMGWISQESGGTRIVSHSGIVPDFGAFMALVPEQKKGLVLLFNANHAMLKLTLDEVGGGAAELLAGVPRKPAQFGAAVWLMRGMLLLPILQAVGAAAAWRQIRRWRREPALRPRRARLWAQHILLPLIPNLAILSGLRFVRARRMLPFLRIFMPDGYWVLLISGGLAGIWSLFGPVLTLRAWGKGAGGDKTT